MEEHHVMGGVMALDVREMGMADLDAVLAIENASFISPWSRESFLYELLENKRAVYLVAKIGETIAGYIGMWVILDEGHITNLAVAPAYRRQGVGARLLDSLTELAVGRGVSRLTLEVRRSNLGAQLLYIKKGFTQCGLRKHYYRDNNEDALIMWKTIQQG